MAKPNVVGKEMLLDAAKECLVNRGMQRFTLRAVAEAGGVTQGTIYYHFRTKEQLLIDIAEDVCSRAREKIDKEQTEEGSISYLLDAAKTRSTTDVFYYKLVLTLIVIGFELEEVAVHMGAIFDYESKVSFINLQQDWKKSPIKGVSIETWGILLNSMIDGLALQIVQNKDFEIEDIYEELEALMEGLNELANKSDRPKGFGMLKRNSLF